VFFAYLLVEISTTLSLVVVVCLFLLVRINTPSMICGNNKHIVQV
jgi:hypothetical protein